MGRNLPTILVAAVIIVVIVCMMCAYQVRFTETVVVTKFDKIVSEQPKEPGLHFKWPWPIEKVNRFDKRLRAFETEFRQAATEDQKTVILTAYATWRIADGAKFLTAVGREDRAADKIKDLLDNQVQLVLRMHPLSALVNTDPNVMKLDEIETKFLDGIKDAAKQRYGMEVVSVGIKRLGLPESVTKDVFARMKEDRQTEIKKLTAEGEAKATEIRVTAEEISKKIIARAQSYAKTIRGQGDAEAAKYYRIFAENPDLSAFLKKLETVEQIFEAGQITLVLDADKFVPFDILETMNSITVKSGASGSVGATDDQKAALSSGSKE